MHRVAQMVDVMIGETSAAGALGPLRAHTLRLSNGVEIPGVGFGIGSKENVIHALEQGYTHLDTARVYGGGQCEVDIGEVMASDKWPRASVFVTTKTSSYGPADNTYMWDPDEDAMAGVEREFATCLARLGLPHVDMLLLHWPGPPPGTKERPNTMSPKEHAAKRLAMWRALEAIYARGEARAIGVSNYTVEKLQALISECSGESADRFLSLKDAPYIYRCTVCISPGRGSVHSHPPLHDASYLCKQCISYREETVARLSLRTAMSLTTAGCWLPQCHL